MDLFKDKTGFCVITQIENENRAIYADVYGGFYEAPLAWMRKAADFLNNGNYERGLRMIDMISENYKRRTQA